MIHLPGNIAVRQLASHDFDPLLSYLDSLGAVTRSRFGPHGFEPRQLIDFYNTEDVKGFIAFDSNTNRIIAYSVIKKGLLPHDQTRLAGYGYTGIKEDGCTYAPSVADDWQGKGIGRQVFDHILQYCREQGIQKIILWGGVQQTNEKALLFYKKLGFVTLGQFEYNGFNQDMLLEL